MRRLIRYLRELDQIDGGCNGRNRKKEIVGRIRKA